LAEIAPASLPSFWSGVMYTPDGEAAIEEQGPSFDVVGEVVGVAAALATEPPQEASVRGDDAGSEGGEPVRDQEARSIENADAGSEEEKPGDEHGASHAGHVGQDSQEERQRQSPEYHKAEKLEEESEALGA